MQALFTLYFLLETADQSRRGNVLSSWGKHTDACTYTGFGDQPNRLKGPWRVRILEAGYLVALTQDFLLRCINHHTVSLSGWRNLQFLWSSITVQERVCVLPAGGKITCVKSWSCSVGCSFTSLYWDFPLFYPVMFLLKIYWKNAFLVTI